MARFQGLLLECKSECRGYVTYVVIPSSSTRFGHARKEDQVKSLPMETIERYRGCHLGLAIGDALGTTLEFQVPGSFAPIHDIVGGGPFGLAPGQWTDDTSMTLCLAASLILCKGFDPVDQLQRYLKWYREGYMSCTGKCFDIGITVQAE
jgi:ADP-ribosylglycohydrolase